MQKPNEAKYNINNTWWIDLRQVRSIELRDSSFGLSEENPVPHIFIRYNNTNQWDEWPAKENEYNKLLIIWTTL